MNKTYLTQNQLLLKAREIADQIKLKGLDGVPLKLYGVPRGGIPAAYAVSTFLSDLIFVDRASDADIIIDDVIDSGKTKESFKREFPDKQFIALYDKTKQDKDIGWIVFPWEENEEGSVEDAVIRTLQYIGEDVEREGIEETPARVIKSYEEIYSGYKVDPKELFKTFDSHGNKQIVLLQDIEFFSMCEHHMLPFIGKAHVAYIPDKRVIGISKLARLLEVYSRRIQIQERIGEQVTNDLMKYLHPVGAACIIEAKHLCMQMRGIAKQHSIMKTSSLKGIFLEDSIGGSSARTELFNLLR